ncbi:m-phase inducer phosphatase [Vanrija albida]|uniref:M-phase inducer phosphatase n=1 Tax=Vanrija albida TaxID=181172 RepID=A0ABR3QAD3_9TREE
MDAFSSSPLAESFPSGRFGSPDASPTPTQSPSPTKTEVDFPADVDQSFNSSMSISTTDSPPPSPSMSRGAELLSPTPTFVLKPPRRPELAGQSLQLLSSARTIEPLGTRARPLGPARTFGRELSLNTRPLNFAQPSLGEKGKMLPPAVPENKTAASPVRMQWTLSHEDMSSPRVSIPHMGRRDSAPTLESPRHVGLGDSMDVDSPRRVNQSPSMDGSPGLGSFFCESPAAPSAVPPSKRRTLVASSPASPSSSPSTRRSRPDKVVSSGALLFGVGSRANTVASRRSVPYTKRPSLTPVAPADGSRATTSTTSAYPILYGPPRGFGLPRVGPQTMRRAISVTDQHTPGPDGSESESEFEASPSVNPTAAEYQRRHGSRPVLPRIDGSPGFKTAKSSSSSTAPPPPLKSPYGPGGLPGFGDNEVDGKVLPCHKVKEDGLVRITPQTMTDLLAGKYNGGMKRYHILDCRFDYEYEGGHIDGAINVRSMEQLDELLLTATTGVNADGPLPQPSRSGQADAAQQVVLIFHCEFSAKRAPTFAKHLRSRDRMLNNSIYPKIFYPELYILEGGYCDFFKKCPTRCEPQSYVPMDDPRHFERRNSDLHDFRKFSRTRSFTYGELQPGSQPSRAQPCPPLVYAAASAATSRRGGNGPTITEEHEPDSSGCEASPCPRALSMGQAPIFGSSKGRAAGRTLQRFNSYAGASLL